MYPPLNKNSYKYTIYLLTQLTVLPWDLTWSVNNSPIAPTKMGHLSHKIWKFMVHYENICFTFFFILICLHSVCFIIPLSVCVCALFCSLRLCFFLTILYLTTCLNIECLNSQRFLQFHPTVMLDGIPVLLLFANISFLFLFPTESVKILVRPRTGFPLAIIVCRTDVFMKIKENGWTQIKLDN